MKRGLFIGVAFILLLLVVGLVRLTNQPITTSSPDPSTEIADEEENIIVPSDFSETTQLEAIDPYIGDGTATRSFDGNTFTHSVVANIEDPAEGKFYEGWLVNKIPTLTIVSTGKLIKQDTVYTVSFTSEQDYSEYMDVVITEETLANGLDGKPEAHVLEGVFQK